MAGWSRRMKVSIHDRRGQVVRYEQHRGVLPKRVPLVPYSDAWTEIERDAVTMIECALANRGCWRRGDVERIPLAVSFIQHWLRKSPAPPLLGSAPETAVLTPAVTAA